MQTTIDRKIYPLRDDFVFKVVFGQEGNERLLARLIDALLHFEGDRCIDNLQLLNPFNLKDTPDDKFSIVDVKATDRGGRRFTIEMQARSDSFFTRRMAYYLALLYAGQLKAGHGFDELNPSYGIAILNDILLPTHPTFESHFRFQEQTRVAPGANELVLPDLMELHFVELPKYVDRKTGLRSRLEKWLHILKFGEQYAAGKKLPEDFQDEKELLMAMEEMKRVNADERLRAILEQREKEEHIRVTALHEAERRGIEKGIEKGRDEVRGEEKAEVARKMLAKGSDPALITELTGLSATEIERIKAKPST